MTTDQSPDRAKCSGLIGGMRDEMDCPDCGHRVGSHTHDHHCDICDIIESLA